MTVNIAPNNAGIYYSPGNWNVSGTDAIAVNGGAYFKTLLVNTTTCVLNFNVTNMPTGVQTQVYWRTDRYGPWQGSCLATPTVAVALPTQTSGYAQHFLEFIIKAVTQTAEAWTLTNTPNVAVDFQGMTLDTGASVTLPFVAPKKILIFGDSITAGTRTVSASLATDVADADATIGYSMQLGAMLGAEMGIVGWPAQGWIETPAPVNGTVPNFQGSYASIYSGVSRSFSGLDLILINEGQNDGSTNTTAAVTTILNGIAAAGYSNPILLIEPFNSSIGPTQKAFLLAGIAAASNPSQSHVLTTTGFFNSSYSSDGTHPYGFADIGYIAPQLAALIYPFL